MLPMKVALGKTPPVFSPKRLMMSKYTAKLAPAPMIWNPTLKPVNLQPLMNAGAGAVGDCAIAEPFHLIQNALAQVGTTFDPTDAMAMAAYKSVSGYDGTPATDSGCNINDVMKHWMKVGFGGYRIDAYADLAVEMSDALKTSPYTLAWRSELDKLVGWFKNVHGKAPAAPTGLPLWQQQVMDTIYYFEECDIGLALPETSEAQDGETWDVVKTRGTGAPGSRGGHCVGLMAPYDDQMVTVDTWGLRMKATWRFLAEYMDEAKLVVGKFLVGDTGKTPLGFDFAQLMADKDEVTA